MTGAEKRTTRSHQATWQLAGKACGNQHHWHRKGIDSIEQRQAEAGQPCLRHPGTAAAKAKDGISRSHNLTVR